MSALVIGCDENEYAAIRTCYPESKHLIDNFFKNMRSRYSENHVQLLWSIQMSSREVMLVDQQTRGFVERVKDVSNRTFCLTTCGVDSFGIIESLSDWRINELVRLGLSFKESYQSVSSDDLDEYIIIKDQTCKPSYKDGILFACSLDKGDVLRAYFKHENFTPKRIVFVDDRMSNVKSVEKYCESSGIEYIGVEYTAVKDSCADSKINFKCAQMQLKILEEQQRWVSDVGK